MSAITPGTGGLRMVGLVTIIIGFIAVYISGNKLIAKEPASMTISDITYWPAIPLEVNKDRTQIGKEKACIYMLVRNRELEEALGSIRQLEDRFNKKYKYPWVFLNDDHFTEQFMVMTSGMVSGESYYGHIPAANWSVPDSINQTKFQECLEKARQENIIYGDSISYHNMCRFNSGQFFRHPLLDPYDWYWRVEPGVEFYCDQNYDPFTFMRENNKVYGFVITISEYFSTIPTLWPTVKEFFAKHPEYVAEDSSIPFLTDRRKLREEDVITDYGDQPHNGCHFWSNFEIGNLNFWRSQPYLDYFNYLDQSGGFYYERWGDAPVHSWALMHMLNKSQIHHFSDIGYYHLPFFRMPYDDASYVTGRCWCPRPRGEDCDFQGFSCLPKWWIHAGKQSLFKLSEHQRQEW